MIKNLKKLLERCPLCKKEYYKNDFILCDKCNNFVCYNCAIVTRKYGTYCKSCLIKLSYEKQKEITKIHTRLSFWAKNGYQIFIGLVVITIFCFSLFFLTEFFFILGLVMAVISLIYGISLFKFLSKS
jgi:hypothetical protein